MKKTIIIIVAAFVLFIADVSPGWAGEINVNWRAKIDSSSIRDMEFMPGQDNFIISTPYFLQVRSCEDGAIIKTELISKYWGGEPDIEFTPDSNNILLCYNNTIEIRNVNNLKVQKSIFLEPEEGFDLSFYEMKVDPKRPFIYLLRHRQQHNANNKISRKVMIYNYNTLEYVGDLPLGNDTNVVLHNLSVSKDGKYAACSNSGLSKIMVWSLDTRQRICDKYILDNPQVSLGNPTDLKFSEINSDIIYFAGVFPTGVGNEGFCGICTFSISQNRIIDSTFATGKNQTCIYRFHIFDQENRLFGTGSGYIIFLNLTQKLIELKKYIMNDPDGISSGVNDLYNNSKNYFIGGSGKVINKFMYNPQTGVDDKNPSIIVYPNPTDGIVNLPFNCANEAKYEIYNSTGNQIKTYNLTGVTGNLISIDFSTYTAGIYYIKLYCWKQVFNYQIVKKG